MARTREHRREERKDLLSHLEVRNRNSDEVMGYIANITTGGFALYCKRPIPFASGDVIPVEIRLPWRIYGDDRIILDAAPVWSKRDQNLNMFVMGFRIHRAEPDQRKLVEKAIERMGPDRKSFGPERYIFSPENVSLADADKAEGEKAKPNRRHGTESHS